MVVTPQTFRRHLEWIRAHFQAVRLQEWVKGNRPPGRACAITFDDGWHDNYEFAWPLLRALEMPATIFPVSSLVGTMETFWPNRLARILKAAHLDSTLEALSWLGVTERAFNTEALSEVVARCKALPESQLLDLIGSTEAQLGLAAPSEPSLVTWEQLREMTASGLIDVGSHTCHHVRLLADTPLEVIRNEVVESKLLLEKQLARPVEVFCYPNGDVSEAALRLVSTHYHAAVTTRRGINTGRDSLFQLKRIAIHEDISSTETAFLSRVSGWL